MGTSGISALAAGLALGLASMATAQDRASAPPATRDTSLFARSVGLQYLDGQLWAAGRDFKVLFEEDRLTYTPALGRQAPRSYPLTMRVESFGRGATRSGVGPAELSAEDLTARYRRAEFTETYEIRPEGIKQSFVFDRLPAGSGDLVVRARIETDLQPARTGLIEGNLLFSIDGLGGVDIGAVVGIDGEGARIQGSMHYEQGVLEMRLPAAFVEQATLPLVVDPLIGSQIAVRVSQDSNRNPDVAYDLTNDLYLVVFEHWFSTGDSDIEGHRVNSDGTLNGNLILIRTSSLVDVSPAVANVNLRDAFVVVYELRAPSGYGSVSATVISAATGTITGNTGIAADGVAPDVGGDITMTHDKAIVVYEQITGRPTFTHVAVAQEIVVDATGTPSRPRPARGLSPPALGTYSTFGLRIAKSGGLTGRYLVVYGGSDIVGVVIDRDVYVLDSIIIDGTAASDQWPEVDGDGTNWIVAWEEWDSVTRTPEDVYLRPVQYGPVTGTAVPLARVTVSAQAGVSESSVSVAWVSDGTCLVGWESMADGQSADSDLHVRSVDISRGLGCEGSFTVRNTTHLDFGMRMASQHSGGGSSENALLVWQETTSATPQPSNLPDILGRRWTTADGIHNDLGGGCGNGGSNRAPCARVGNPNFTVRLRDAAPNAAAWLILGLDRFGGACGPCTLVPNPWTGFVITGGGTGPSGHANRLIPIPNAPSLAGARFYTQWLVSGTGCTVLNSDLSPAQAVNIQ